MAALLIASDSVVFRAFVRERLAAAGLSEGGEIFVAATDRILLEKLEQHSMAGLVIDGQPSEAFPDFDGTLSTVRQRFPGVRILVAGGASRVPGVDEAPRPPVDAAEPAQREEFARKLVGWFSGSHGLAIQARTLGAAAVGAAATPGKHSHPHAKDHAKDHAMAAAAKTATPIDWPINDLFGFTPKVLVIGSSTGGPAALERFFSHMRPRVNVPILVVQHMPPDFTRLLAERIEAISGLPSVEGKSGMVVKPGHVIVAPGDFHMTVTRLSPREAGNEGEITVVLDQRPLINSVRPAVDPLFETATGLWGRSTLALVFTGMGEDGKQGALAVRAAGGVVGIQDAASCTVWGMPRAVYEARACDVIGTPDELGAICARLARPIIR